MQKPLMIDEATARNLYPKADVAFKALLETNFGKKTLLGDVKDRIKTFEDACAELGIDPASVVNNCDEPDEAAYKKLKVIVKALNEGWVGSAKDLKQPKYYPWFDFTPGSGFGLSYYDYGLWHTYSYVGVRLSFKSSSLAEYAGKQFIEIYAHFMIEQPAQ